ncbi:MAG: hypothetical protein VCF24_04050 [Candidatus Latescibacterota bacterium]
MTLPELPADAYTDALSAFSDPPCPSAACADADELIAWQQEFRQTLARLTGWCHSGSRRLRRFSTRSIPVITAD